MGINKVCISGNLTREPELRRTQSGNSVLSMGVAVNDRRRNPQTGEWEDYANFVDCVMWGNRAEALAQYLHKGSKVAIDGKLRWSQWEKDGQRRSKLEVIVDELEMMTQRQGGSGGGYGAQGQQAGGYAYGGGSAPQAAPQQPQGGYQQPAQQQYQQQPQAAPQQAVELEPNIYDEDIPFGG